MRVTVLVGALAGFIATLLYTLCVMEWREEAGRSYWAVAATFKPGPGSRSVWLFLAVSAGIPVLVGGMLGDCRWTRWSLRFAAGGAVLLALAAWGFFAHLPAKHGRAGANTRGVLVLDSAFASALAGAKLAERRRGRRFDSAPRKR
jgi:hypothetical protein